MAEHHHAHATPDDQYLDTTGAGHEHTDANVWMIIQFAIWLMISAVATHFLMWGMFEWFVTDRNAAAPVAEFPLARSRSRGCRQGRACRRSRRTRSSCSGSVRARS